MAKKVIPFEIYRDSKKKYRWRVRTVNGRILSASSESYTRRIDCVNCAIKTFEILAQSITNLS